ncbi:hypothetical protein RRG08_056850 [Elysia crispata]|uniref:Uncharacterized protein n=1 Tax=Elysia crispata TaxID=231223 RepID=A0AAE1ABJ0_9GAST|nr:hypothetical protein RRG08_056850 [Elysia crispata]
MLALKLTLDIVFDRLLNPIIRHDAMGSLGYNNRLFTLRYNIQEDCSRLKGADAVVIKAVSYTSSNVKVGALSQRAVHYMQSVSSTNTSSDPSRSQTVPSSLYRPAEHVSTFQRPIWN